LAACLFHKRAVRLSRRLLIQSKIFVASTLHPRAQLRQRAQRVEHKFFERVVRHENKIIRVRQN
jgi:hypothetical protein